MRRALLVVAWLGAWSPAAIAQPAKTPIPTSNPSPIPTPTASPTPAATPSPTFTTYQSALAARRLGTSEPMRLDDVRARLAEDEGLVRTGRLDEAVARLVELTSSPQFEPYADGEEGRASVYLLGDALAQTGAYDPARAALRQLLTMPDAWGPRGATWSHRATRRLVDIALETERWERAIEDLKIVPASTPREETRGEVLYVTGRAKEASGDWAGAEAAYAQVGSTSRFWSQATYLRALIAVEHGRWKEGEDLFCKVADPKRQDRTAPVFADEKFFAVRDLARLALGRVAHEQGRFDDARYYYYLVPRDSDRLAEALYEAATTRYEKKDYEGARELLDELKALQIHHRYEDEAWILDAYIDLAQCKFPEADQKLIGFLARYEPVRDATRRILADPKLGEALLLAARTGTDAAASNYAASVSPDAMRAIAALVRLDPQFGSAARLRAVADHEASGLRLATGTLGDVQRTLATNGGVRAATDDTGDAESKAQEAKDALDGVKRQIVEAEANHASPEALAPLKDEAQKLEARLSQATGQGQAHEAAAAGGGTDLADLLRADASQAQSLYAQLDKARADLASKEAALAADAMHRLDLRLSRLLRRARLGRIESVLGRKRALEVEIEAINLGILPHDAVDSLDAARYLKDDEEYWPFEGDDWPDEFVGGDTK